MIVFKFKDKETEELVGILVFNETPRTMTVKLLQAIEDGDIERSQRIVQQMKERRWGLES
jgi:hypothetical protein